MGGNTEVYILNKHVLVILPQSAQSLGDLGARTGTEDFTFPRETAFRPLSLSLCSSSLSALGWARHYGGCNMLKINKSSALTQIFSLTEEIDIRTNNRRTLGRSRGEGRCKAFQERRRRNATLDQEIEGSARSRSESSSMKKCP